MLKLANLTSSHPLCMLINTGPGRSTACIGLAVQVVYSLPQNTITTLKEENIDLRRYKNTHDGIQEGEVGSIIVATNFILDHACHTETMCINSCQSRCDEEGQPTY